MRMMRVYSWMPCDIGVTPSATPSSLMPTMSVLAWFTKVGPT